MSRPALDLTKRHFVHPHLGKGITVYGTWWRNNDGTVRPCIVLLPTARKINHQLTPCVITLDDAFKWDIEDTKLSAKQRHAVQVYMSNAAREFAIALGLGDSKLSIATVINVVHDELGELLTLPPVPPGEIQVVADGFITNQDGRTIHREIVERV